MSLSGLALAKEKKTGNILSITMNDDHLTEGELLAVHGNVLILLPTAGRDTIHVPISNIRHIQVRKESKFLEGLAGGFVSAGLTGAFIGFLSGDDKEGFFRLTASEKALTAGVAFGTIGAILGGIGGALAGADQSVSINSTSPDKVYRLLNKLNSYARYESGLPDDFTVESITDAKERASHKVEAKTEIADTMNNRNVSRSRDTEGRKRFHISVTPGYFISSGVDNLKDLIQHTGFTDKESHYNWWGEGELTTTEYPRIMKNQYLCLKDIKIDYSLTDILAVGVSYSQLGEHGASGRRVIRGVDYREKWDTDIGRIPHEYVDTYIVGFYKGRAYFLSLSYFPVPDTFLRKQTIKATGGIGYFRTKFDFYGTDWEFGYDSPTDFSPVDHREFSKDNFGFILSAELIHFFNRWVSIGLNVDYKYTMVKTGGFSIDSYFSYFDDSAIEGSDLRIGALNVEIPEHRWKPGGFGFGVNIGFHL
jgi:hypothetical protein